MTPGSRGRQRPLAQANGSPDTNVPSLVTKSLPKLLLLYPHGQNNETSEAFCSTAVKTDRVTEDIVKS